MHMKLDSHTLFRSEKVNQYVTLFAGPAQNRVKSAPTMGNGRTDAVRQLRQYFLPHTSLEPFTVLNLSCGNRNRRHSDRGNACNACNPKLEATGQFCSLLLASPWPTMGLNRRIVVISLNFKVWHQKEWDRAKDRPRSG